MIVLNTCFKLMQVSLLERNDNKKRLTRMFPKKPSFHKTPFVRKSRFVDWTFVVIQNFFSMDKHQLFYFSSS